MECHSLQWREVPEQSSYRGAEWSKESQVASSQLSQEYRLEGLVLWIMYGLSQGDKKWVILDLFERENRQEEISRGQQGFWCEQ